MLKYVRQQLSRVSKSSESNDFNDGSDEVTVTSTSSATTITSARPPLLPNVPMSAAKSIGRQYLTPDFTTCGRDRTDHGKHRERTREKLDMRREADRLVTLERWPISYVDKNSAARTGLFYYGDGDKLKCFFCGIELGEWEEGDNPATDHERWRPLCPLLRGIAYTNIPLNPNDTFTTTTTTNGNPSSTGVGQDVCGPCNNFEQQNGPVRPAYALESSRLASFADWPCRMKQRPEVMADAGFFYTGVGDKTVCFYCGVGLKDWEDDDDPWEQHARWFPTCHYIRLVKGEAFVQEIQSKSVERTDDDNVKSTSDNMAGPSQSSSLVTTTVTTTTPTPTPTMSVNDVKTATSDEIAKNENSLCKMCYSAERNICFVPCGHVVACPKCALAVQVCPVCRQKFTSTMRLYYS